MIISNEYFAGLFDGEGWFSIRRQDGSRVRSVRPYTYAIVIGLTMREQWLVEEFQKRFGGTVTIQKSISDKHSKYYKWHGSAGTTKNFIDEVGPFILAKKEHVLVASEFLKEKSLANNQPVPDERYSKYEGSYEKMKKLNMKGVGK